MVKDRIRKNNKNRIEIHKNILSYRHTESSAILYKMIIYSLFYTNTAG